MGALQADRHDEGQVTVDKRIAQLEQVIKTHEAWEHFARQCLNAAWEKLANTCTENEDCLHCQIGHILG